MDNKFSASTSLGYAVLFVSLWLWYMAYTGWIAISDAQTIIPTMLILGGVVLAIAGIFSFFNGDKIETVLFLVIAAYSFSFVLRMMMYPNLAANSNPAAVDGWQHFLVCVVVFCLWFGGQGGKSMRQLFLLALGLSELIAAIWNWTGALVLGTIAGYIGLIAAILALLYFLSTIRSAKEPSAA